MPLTLNICFHLESVHHLILALLGHAGLLNTSQLPPRTTMALHLEAEHLILKLTNGPRLLETQALGRLLHR